MKTINKIKENQRKLNKMVEKINVNRRGIYKTKKKRH